MGIYTSFWTQQLKTIQKQITLTQESTIEIGIPEIHDLGTRVESGYNGFLQTWIGRVENLTNSAVFRNLRDVITSEKNFHNMVPGQAEFRINNNSVLTVSYSPITYDLLLKRYKRNREETFPNEQYKWIAIQDFQVIWEKYQSKEISFVEFFEKIDFKNLVYPMAVAVFRDLLKQTPEEFEALLVLLFNEDNELHQRVEEYRKQFETLYFGTNNPGKNTFQDRRTIATLLTFRYPEKYTFFKDSFYTKYCKGNGIKPKDSIEKLFHYYEIISAFISKSLSKEGELIKWKSEHLDDSCYPDPNNMILAQDIFYSVLDSITKAEIDAPDEEDSIVSDVDEKKSKKMETPLNQILYGPPGTGKTYSTINHALSIIEGRDPSEIELDQRPDIKKRFDSYLNSGQIEFISFHQSLNYEDFIEGIKPISPEDETATLKYAIEDGIFKRIANSAREAIKLKSMIGTSNPIIDNDLLEKAQFFKISLGDTNNPNDDEIYQYCIRNNCISIGWGGKIDFSGTLTEQEVKKVFEERVTDLNPRDYGIFAMKCLKFGMKQNDIVFVSNGNFKLRAIGKIDGDYYFDANAGIRYNQFRKVAWLYTDLDIPVNEIYASNFSQQTIYYLYNNKVKKEYFIADTHSFGDENKKYVLIIDEINRGNIANIFGELITLLETDKRWGKNEQLELTLPYSKEKFSVPPNLYLIGTMNTADRSVEALDTALRRRFSFVEMAPNYNLDGLQTQIIEGITLSGLLQKMNQRIEKLLDKDHVIGHSYFLNVKDTKGLKQVYKNNIIPLLQEYFFGDTGKIALILDQGFFEPVMGEKKGDVLAKIDWYDSREDLEERLVVHMKDLDKMKDAEFEAAIQALMNIPQHAAKPE